MAVCGYDVILKTLGRHLRDFLNGLDNLHEYLKKTYPKIDAPSFYCEDESEFGLTLNYRYDAARCMVNRRGHNCISRALTILDSALTS